MTIWEYLAQPDHPWLNTDAYTVGQIVLFTTGAVLWIVVYVAVIRRLIVNQELEIPWIAVSLNIGNEVTNSIFFVPDMGLALVIAYWAWLMLDIYIVRGLFKYGVKQITTPYLKQRFTKLMAVWIPVLIVVQLTFTRKYDLPMAPLDSFIINLVMSAAFIYMVFVPRTTAPSQVVAWCKFLGTGIIGVMFYNKYPDNNALTTLFVANALVDMYYIYLVHNFKTIRPDAPAAELA